MKSNIIELYKMGFGHAEIVANTGRTLEEVRKVISKATKDYPKLYQEHVTGGKNA